MKKTLGQNTARLSALIIGLSIFVSGCDREDATKMVDSAKSEAAQVIADAKEMMNTAEISAITGKACEFVEETKEEALAITSVASGLVGGASAAAGAAGVTAVAHSSGAVILTGSAGYIAGTLGSAGAATVGVLTAPATAALAAVSVVAVGSAVYICR